MEFEKISDKIEQDEKKSGVTASSVSRLDSSGKKKEALSYSAYCYHRAGKGFKAASMVMKIKNTKRK